MSVFRFPRYNQIMLSRLPFPWKVGTGDLLGSLPTLPTMILRNFPFYSRRLNEYPETLLIFTMYSPLTPRLLTFRTYLMSFAVFLVPQIILFIIDFFFLISPKYRKTKLVHLECFFIFHVQKNLSISQKLFLPSLEHTTILFRAGQVNQQRIIRLFTLYVDPYWLPSLLP